MMEAGFGRAGDPKKVTRTVRVDVSDAMRFTPARPTAERGETVKFVVQNSGDVPRELVLGTMEDLQAHAEPMRKHPGMDARRARPDGRGRVAVLHPWGVPLWLPGAGPPRSRDGRQDHGETAHGADRRRIRSRSSRAGTNCNTT